MQVTRSHGSTLKNMLTKADKLAVQNTPSIIDEAKQHADQLLKHEIERLVALKELNPNVREDEIQHLQVLNDDIQERLNMTIAQLDAVRVIIAI
jgi:ATP-dependent helicase HepA